MRRRDAYNSRYGVESDRESEDEKKLRRTEWMIQQQRIREHEEHERRKIEEYERIRTEKLAQERKERESPRRSPSRTNSTLGNKPFFRGPEETKKITTQELKNITVQINRNILSKSTETSDVRHDVINREKIVLTRRDDMDRIGDPSQTQSLEGFNFLFYLTEGVGGLLIILVAMWTTQYRGGLTWRSNPGTEFNWHPLLMTIGLVFLYGNGMLIYRSQRAIRKRRLKLMHGGIMVFAFVFTLIALVAAFDSHNLKVPPIPNLYTLHSWVGLATVILFFCQYVAGFISFLYPMIQAPLRASFMPIHVYFGTAGFVGAIASCLMGLTEKAIWSVPNYADLPGEGVLVNIIGFLFVTFGGLTVYLVSQERYKRLPRPEDNVLLTGRSE